MAVNVFLWGTLAGGVCGFALSAGAEQLIRPRPVWRRPASAWAVHSGVCFLLYAVLLLLMGRPICALIAELAVIVTLVLVSNAKFKSLREPFIVQDYDYFIDTLRFPRLFLPFLGVKSFCLATVGFVVAIAGLVAEPVPEVRFWMNGQLGGILALASFGLFLLKEAKPSAAWVRLEPAEDLKALGLIPSCIAYALALRVPPRTSSPFDSDACALIRKSRGVLPHLIAIQSESFFDARELCGEIRRDVLAHFDVMCVDARSAGKLHVPAWGANTVRTEVSFLTGISATDLGAHRFSPYQTFGRTWKTGSIASCLRAQGYHTVCIHPYYGSFYRRREVLKLMGFESFIDITSFAGARHAGAYVADREVGVRILDILRQASGPTFVFAITMENHGPLELEIPPDLKEAERLFVTLPKPGCEELGTYLRHLRNADSMLKDVKTGLMELKRPTSLCFYGDHVPIMPYVYAEYGIPQGLVPYFCWDTPSLKCQKGWSDARERSCGEVSLQHIYHSLAVHDLAMMWLQIDSDWNDM